MAWLSVVLIEDTSDEDDQGRLKATKVYYAEADTFVTTDAGYTADDGTTAVPLRTASYSVTRARAKVTDRHVDRVSAKKLKVTVNFADPTDGSDAATLLAKPAKIVTDGGQDTEEYAIDYDSPPKYVRNSAGEPFDQGPQRRVQTRIYTITKYVQLVTRNAILAAENTNNSGPKTIDGLAHDTDTLLLFDPHFETVETTGAGVYLATFRIEYKAGYWKDVALDVGFSELASGGRKAICEVDASGNQTENPIAKPWPLNPDGSKKADPADDPDTLEFWPYPQASWSGVPLS
jgi:hypothetical protein